MDAAVNIGWNFSIAGTTNTHLLLCPFMVKKICQAILIYQNDVKDEINSRRDA
jgi:hypothetical protein